MFHKEQKKSEVNIVKLKTGIRYKLIIFILHNLEWGLKGSSSLPTSPSKIPPYYYNSSSILDY
ncbi:hypothetical protein BpHYR1_038843 [Brachionus plicatilis]|uniref:Uncharacterized protein n=1 Tax=Brachionus plicatilis TaxID=10195 RepID=A0A3M7R1X7_BRAPC|nr:hypothetical protein BpHYR1_038843 [Brachionus plicatilis]